MVFKEPASIRVVRRHQVRLGFPLDFSYRVEADGKSKLIPNLPSLVTIDSLINTFSVKKPNSNILFLLIHLTFQSHISNLIFQFRPTLYSINDNNKT